MKKAIYKIRCDGCGKYLIRNVHLGQTCPNFCSNECKRESKNIRRKLLPLHCPTPHKKAYNETKYGNRAAIEHAKDLRKLNNWKPEDNWVSKVYLCQCKKLHVGTFKYIFLGYTE
jgi:hypothetical protein